MEYSWCLLLLVLSFSVIGSNSQFDSNGFINIDCGIPANSISFDSTVNLTYLSDDQFIDTGMNYKIASEYATDSPFEQFLTLRSFPNGTRNCYTLRSLKAGSKYLIRATFMYGNYDNLNKLPTFDIYVGISPWKRVIVRKTEEAFKEEIFTAATSDFLQVCLVNLDLGTPFISGLELRPLDTSIYPANSTHSLVNIATLNLGETRYVRYPSDPYDRFWVPFTLEGWTPILTRFRTQPDTDLAIPSIVMQTAATTISTKQPLTISWSSYSISSVYLVILHFYEMPEKPLTAIREFNILKEGNPLARNVIIPPGSSQSGAYWDTGYTEYNVSLEATSISDLPPLLNAFELYASAPVTGVPTYNGDVSAIESIKANYRVSKGWSGDPCVPTNFSWAGVSCTPYSNKIPRITSLNLSSSGLTGPIVSSFGNLSALKSLDLSYNGLSGALPTSLDQLVALTYLDITGNSKISTILPPSLQKKQKDGVLTFKFGDATTTSTPSTDATMLSKKKKFPVLIIAVAGVVVLLVIVAATMTVLCLSRRRYNQLNIPKPNGTSAPAPPANTYMGNYASTQEAPLAFNMGNYASSPEAPQANIYMGNYQNTPEASNPQRNNAF